MPILVQQDLWRRLSLSLPSLSYALLLLALLTLARRVQLYSSACIFKLKYYIIAFVDLTCDYGPNMITKYYVYLILLVRQ